MTFTYNLSFFEILTIFTIYTYYNYPPSICEFNTTIIIIIIIIIILLLGPSSHQPIMPSM